VEGATTLSAVPAGVRALICAAALALTGCGGGGSGADTPHRVDATADERQATRAIERLEDAINKGEARRICNEILAEETTGPKCTHDTTLLLRHPMYRRFAATVRDVNVTGERATALVVLKITSDERGERESYPLVKEGGEWRVAIRLGG
jgi:hypothetical protein